VPKTEKLLAKRVSASVLETLSCVRSLEKALKNKKITWTLYSTDGFGFAWSLRGMWDTSSKKV